MNPWSTDAFGSVSIAVSKLKPVPPKEVVYFHPILRDRYRPQTSIVIVPVHACGRCSKLSTKVCANGQCRYKLLQDNQFPINNFTTLSNQFGMPKCCSFGVSRTLQYFQALGRITVSRLRYSLDVQFSSTCRTSVYRSLSRKFLVDS